MQEVAPPTPPTPPAPVLIRTGQNVYTITGSDPVAQYEASTAQRDELRSQVETLQDQRRSLENQLNEEAPRGADRAGIEARIAAVDARIAATEKQIEAANARVAQAAAVPGAVAGHEAHMRTANRREGPPEEVFVLGGMFIVIVFVPLSIAFARRIWRRSAQVVSAIPGELMERMSRLEQAVESIAIEVERVGEGQRFMTKVMTDVNARGLGAGPAEPIRQAVREQVPVRSDTPR